MKLLGFILFIFPMISFASYMDKKILTSSGKASKCSGSLVAFEGYNKDSRALYMTNGHCTYINNYFGHYLAPGEIVLNLPKKKRVKILQDQFNLFGQEMAKIFTSKVLFATMSVRDIAIYELELSYMEIQNNFNLQPLIIIGSSGVKLGDKLQIISGKREGVWTCIFKRTSKNKVYAGPYNWTNTLVMNDCDKNLIEGTSGSPTLLEGTRYVVGLHNAMNKCSLYNACEKNSSGKMISEKNDSFSQNIDFLFSCLNEEKIFKPELCKLP